MTKDTPPPDAPHERSDPAPANGWDEMNLAEFPFASLRRRGDGREAIIHEGWIVDKNNQRQHQRWIVRGLAGVGLPTEFDERVYVALMAVSSESGFKARKVPFSIYRVLRMMGEDTNKKHYELVEGALDRLKGVTVKAEGAFWDNDKKELVRTVMAFNLIDKYWLRYREGSAQIREEEGVPGYIIWGEDIWRSIKANYIKPLNTEFFYSLESPTSRRLFRFLDKRMQYQTVYEIDIFELASRLGMVRYAKPVWVRRKLEPAFAELIARGFLLRAETVKHKDYTRIRFVRVAKALPQPDPVGEKAPSPTPKEAARFDYQDWLRQRYGVSDALVDTWAEALIEIEGATTQATYQAWFTGTHLLAIENDVALIGVPSEFARGWLEGRMAPVIKRALAGAVNRPVELAFQVLEKPQPLPPQ